MKRIFAVNEDELKFEVATSLNPEQTPTVEDATSVLVMWDDCAKGESLDVRYEALTRALSNKWGVPVTRGTAYLTLDLAVKTIEELKKTHIA